MSFARVGILTLIVVDVRCRSRCSLVGEVFQFLVPLPFRRLRIERVERVFLLCLFDLLQCSC